MRKGAFHKCCIDLVLCIRLRLSFAIECQRSCDAQTIKYRNSLVMPNGGAEHSAESWQSTFFLGTTQFSEKWFPTNTTKERPSERAGRRFTHRRLNQRDNKMIWPHIAPRATSDDTTANKEATFLLSKWNVDSTLLHRDLAIAKDVQRASIPEQPPIIPGLNCATFYKPVYGIGGDYYDFLALPDGGWAIAVGDV